MLWPLLCASPQGVMPPRPRRRRLNHAERGWGHGGVEKQQVLGMQMNVIWEKLNNYEFASTTKNMHALSASLKDEGEAISWLLSKIFPLSFSRELNLTQQVAQLHDISLPRKVLKFSIKMSFKLAKRSWYEFEHNSSRIYRKLQDSEELWWF